MFLLFVMLGSSCTSLGGTPTAFPPWYPLTNEKGDTVFAIFESRIPCADCQTIKFGLALYWEPKTKTPTTYQMSRIHVGQGNDRTVNAGTWTITSGTKLDPQAVVYKLDANAPPEFRTYWAIGQDILFILDPELKPRVGNAGYSYALNKTR
jgi:hypothetical protein